MPLAKFIAALVGLLVVLSMIVRPAPNTREKIYFAAMKGDLRNLITAQEAFFSDSARYAISLQELGDSTRFWTTPGVTVSITEATDRLFRARARHSDLTPPGGCEIAAGFEKEMGDIPDNGEPICKPDRKRRSWIFVWEL